MQKPPLSINEAIVDQFFTRDRVTKEQIPDADIEALYDAMHGARFAAEQAADATQKILANSMRTPAANQKQAREVAFSHFTRASKLIDSARNRVLNTIRMIEAETHAPPPAKDAPMAILHTEIRTALARMPKEDRDRAINDAITSGDNTVVSAMLSGPPMLSGLGPAAVELQRAKWQQRNFADKLDRLSRLRRADSAVEGAGSLLLEYVNSLSDPVQISAAAESERLALQAAAGA